MKQNGNRAFRSNKGSLLIKGCLIKAVQQRNISAMFLEWVKTWGGIWLVGLVEVLLGGGGVELFFF